ncbi:MAG: hypothetical protein KDJ74_01010 [Notoacmeibacter sp.]|nr:hypothetical protein [Notoacmeibacter sp.]
MNSIQLNPRPTIATEKAMAIHDARFDFEKRAKASPLSRQDEAKAAFLASFLVLRDTLGESETQKALLVLAKNVDCTPVF